MEGWRKTATGLLLAFVVFTAGYVVGKEVGARRAGVAAVDPAASAPGEAPDHQIVAYYFHGTKRCDTCNTIEAFGHEAIHEGFPEAIERREIVWQVVNMDLPQNEHFKELYGLVASSLVLVDREKGEDLDFTVLHRTWDLTGDKEVFLAYVQSEVEMYLDVEELDDDDEEEEEEEDDAATDGTE